MLGTLIRGRVTVGGSAGAAARVALDIATRYALQRRQFATPDADAEVIIMDYLVHQRRLLPLIAHPMHCSSPRTSWSPSPRAADRRRPRPRGTTRTGSPRGRLKAANTWHATSAIQEAARPAAAPAIWPRTG